MITVRVDSGFYVGVQAHFGHRATSPGDIDACQPGSVDTGDRSKVKAEQSIRVYPSTQVASMYRKGTESHWTDYALLLLLTTHQTARRLQKTATHGSKQPHQGASAAMILHRTALLDRLSVVAIPRL
jgi:hypothetical protein